MDWEPTRQFTPTESGLVVVSLLTTLEALKEVVIQDDLWQEGGQPTLPEDVRKQVETALEKGLQTIEAIR